MKIAMVQFNAHVGHMEANVEKMIRYAQEAARDGADLVVFPELSVCGYPPQDMLHYAGFIKASEVAVAQLAEACPDIAVVVGAPIRNPDKTGKPLFNAALWLEGGKVRHTRHKTLLPTYDIFDEPRYFEANRQFETISYKDYRIALTICEDIWDEGCDKSPAAELKAKGAELLISINASPFDPGQPAKRQQVIQRICRKHGIPVFYVNHIGAQTDIVFDGGSTVMHASGTLHHRMPFFKEAMTCYDLKAVIQEKKRTTSEIPPEPELLLQALETGVRDYFRKSGFEKAILGLSGGIDSAMTAVVAARALGPKNVKVLLLPYKFTRKASVTDARQLAENLGIAYEVIELDDLVAQYEKTLSPWFAGTGFDTAEENLQARSRAVLLMAFANKFGYILLNTSNKSEIAVGYGTLYGDLCGALSVFGDVYKTRLYELARHINRKETVMPQAIIDKVPSAELRPDQKDTDTLPDYETLDAILHLYIDEAQSRDAIVASGHPVELVEKVTSMVDRSEHKRYQLGPVIRVSPRAFGSGRRMPIVAAYRRL